MRANLIIFILFPFLIWLFILLVIINAVKGNFKKSPGHRSRQNRTAGRTGYTKRQPSVKMSADRPQMQQGLFDMDLGRGKKKTRKSFGSSFGNSDFDSYEAKGRLKDFVSGYDKKLKKGGASQRRAQDMQFSHTYDGHEPWDKCLPKEKDPWDKDFYA
ncbi:MAG: hypothetical protein IJ410_04955 [Oscillospiraceae bacterium]|nr:hypothetical protein [Oscillospiraceae bacterium]